MRPLSWRASCPAWSVTALAASRALSAMTAWSKASKMVASAAASSLAQASWARARV